MSVKHLVNIANSAIKHTEREIGLWDSGTPKTHHVRKETLSMRVYYPITNTGDNEEWLHIKWQYEGLSTSAFTSVFNEF